MSTLRREAEDCERWTGDLKPGSLVWARNARVRQCGRLQDAVNFVTTRVEASPVQGAEGSLIAHGAGTVAAYRSPQI